MKDGLSKARFETIYREGKRVQGELCRLMALPGTGRIGFATPRSLGNTPRRNRLKRQFRSAVESIEKPAGLDLVVSILARADGVPFQQIQGDLAKTLRRMTERWANESESS